MKVSLLIAMLLLSGCGVDRMSNADIIMQTKQCEASGLRAHAIRNNFNLSDIEAIQCEPKEEPRHD